jgi:hypothetical protein
MIVITKQTYNDMLMNRSVCLSYLCVTLLTRRLSSREDGRGTNPGSRNTAWKKHHNVVVYKNANRTLATM